MALLVALLALLLVTAISLGLIVMSNSETKISSNFRDEQLAFFGARGGAEEVRDRLRPAATGSLNASLPSALPGSNNGVLYVTNPGASETVAPWNTAGSNYPDDEICKEVTCNISLVPGGSPWYTTASANASYAASPQLPWKWVRVTAKTNKSSAGTTRTYSVDGASNGNRVCWTGLNEVTVTAASCSANVPPYQQVYIITALSVTPSGSRRMVQFETTTTAFPTVPGPLVFDGSNPIFSNPNSNSLQVVGFDADKGPHNGAGCGAPVDEAAIGAFDPASVTALTDAIPKPARYTGLGSDPSVQNVSSQLGSLATVAGLQALVASVTAAANSPNVYSGDASSITNPGTDANPVINVVTGNLSVGGGFTGSGILLVEGTLTMGGNPSYDGLILVIGKGDLEKNGGGNGTTNGAILVANLYDSSGNPLNPSGPPGVPTINWNGGGTANINYDSCWVSAMNQTLPFRVLAGRELMY